MKTANLAIFTALITITSCASPTNTATEKVKDTAQTENVAAHYSEKIAKKVPKKEQEKFLEEVQATCKNLKVDTNWLLYIFGFEGDFETTKKNYAGSGATGLIQFMPETAADFGTTTAKLAKMSHIEQLVYVEKFLRREIKNNGEFYSLTDIYLGVLYPPAREHLKAKNFGFVLWKKGTVAYTLNAGLDYDKNGSITVLDICKHTHHRFKNETK